MKALLLKRKWAFMVYILASCLFIISDLLYMSLSSMIFDALEKGSLTLFIHRIVLGILILGTMSLLYFTSRFLRIGYMRNVLLDIRMEAFKTILKMSPRQFGKISKENYVSRLTNDINLIEEKFFRSLLNFISGLGLYVFGLIILLVMDRMLALGIFAVSLMVYFICKLFLKRTEQLQEEVSSENEKFTLNMSNTFNGLEIIKLGNIEDKFLDKNKQEISHVEQRKFAFNNFSEVQQNVLLFASYLVMVGVVWYLGLCIAEGMALGSAVFLFQLSNQVVFRTMDTFPLLNVIRSSSKIYNKITQIEEQIELEGQQPFRFNQHMILRNVSFGYEQDQPLLKNISLRIEKGKKYLIKGASGSGKSTLLKMLEMIYDDYEGTIQVDGVDYKSISSKDFNDKVAVIDQDIFLFEDTIENNISLYKPLNDEVMKKAITGAGLEDFIGEKEAGLQTAILENGKNLSGGQRQRIAIARAIAKEAELLFVDEGTASLNEKLGREIEKVFLSLPQTVIAISHRYYEGVSERYDYVLELQGGHVKVHEAKTYFEGVGVC
ncbi:MAG: ABC transporter ATP-binding protein/permease [Candidatus Niameybacter stercoravium]|nr:ABC transporter ATP-binding protein/permease [Candidatus Niameybacter stercoravium]